MKANITIFTFFYLILFQFCKNDEPLPPVITTVAVSEIEYTSAISGGEVTDDGGAAIVSMGICWNTSPEPTTSNQRTIVEGGPGPFTSMLTQLTANTTYYVRA